MMERWRGRVALVTGASAGIGAAIARALVCQGMTVVGLARREHLLQMPRNYVRKMDYYSYRPTLETLKEELNAIRTDGRKIREVGSKRDFRPMWRPWKSKRTLVQMYIVRQVVPRSLHRINAYHYLKHACALVVVSWEFGSSEELADELSEGSSEGKLIPRKCDLSVESDLSEAYAWVDQTLGGADVVINNAGIMDNTPLLDSSTDVWRQMLDINVLALAVSSKLALNSMMARRVDDGHVININSLLGHTVMGNLLPFYSATKWAVTALCQAFQNELCVRQSHNRITSMCPGLTRTELLSTFTEGEGDAALSPADIADAVIYALATPTSVIVAEMKISPNQGSVGHSLAPNRVK